MKLYFILLLLPLFSQAQLLNGSFENWYTDNAGLERLQGWQHVSKNNIPVIALFATSKSTASIHLQHAVTISRWYDHLWDKLVQRNSVNFNPASITGYYKYIDNDIIGERTKDSANIHIILTRWNMVDQRTDTLGRGYIELGPAASYNFFECRINYTAAGIADSFYLDISPSRWEEDVTTYCVTPGYCCFFSLDNLELKDANGNNPSISPGIIFPNPVSNIITINLPIIENSSAKIFNGLGQVVSERQVIPGYNSFNVELLSAGIYYLHVSNRGGRPLIYKFLKN